MKLRTSPVAGSGGEIPSSTPHARRGSLGSAAGFLATLLVVCAALLSLAAPTAYAQEDPPTTTTEAPTTTTAPAVTLDDVKSSVDHTADLVELGLGLIVFLLAVLVVTQWARG